MGNDLLIKQLDNLQELMREINNLMYPLSDPSYDRFITWGGKKMGDPVFCAVYIKKNPVFDLLRYPNLQSIDTIIYHARSKFVYGGYTTGYVFDLLSRREKRTIIRNIINADYKYSIYDYDNVCGYIEKLFAKRICVRDPHCRKIDVVVGLVAMEYLLKCMRKDGL